MSKSENSAPTGLDFHGSRVGERAADHLTRIMTRTLK